MIKLASLFAICALAFSALAAEKTRLQIKVTNLEGKPIDRASVVVNIDRGRSLVKLGRKQLTHWETRTNQDGLVRLPEIPKTDVTIQVIAKGYQTFGQKYTLDEDEKNIDIKLNPPQPQYSAHQ